jgi:PAS domain S-box-containing protein
MTIQRRHQISLVIVLALFAANLFAYFWSARVRSAAQVEWSQATADELRLSSIRQELDLLNKEVNVASQFQQEYGNSLSMGEASTFQRRTSELLTEIDALKATASSEQVAPTEEFRRSYLDLRDAWMEFYRTAGKSDAGSATSISTQVLADNLSQNILTMQLPGLQNLEDARVTHAQTQFSGAERLAHRVIITTFVLSILIAFALSSLLSRHLAFGFATLKHGARLIGNMNLDHRISYPAGDEFSELARSFNEMSEKLSVAGRNQLETNRQLSESESRYRTLFDRAVYGIYRCNDSGRILDANPAMAKMLGYATRQELLDLPSIEQVYCDPRDYQTLLEKLRQHGSVEGLEVQWRTRDGGVITMRLSGSLVISAAGGYEREMIAENVTAHRALEEQLRQSQKMEAVGKLAGGIAHDFNNLLTVIKGHSELLQAELRSNDSARKEVEGVMRAADRAASLTRQLLAFSRRQLLTLKVLDLNSIVTSMERLLGRLLGENIQLSTSLNPSLGMIKADPHQIEQVIMNLAVNARDAMPSGGKLRITTASLELNEARTQGELLLKAGCYALLSVSDNGQGMDAATLSRAFEPFFTTKEQGKGTGLGLATVYGIVKQSEGDIWIESDPGKGTTFHICFPTILETHPAPPPPGKAEPPAGKETILMVEDEEDVRDVASTMLQRRGYRVLTASGAHEAHTLCKSYPEIIHLLLTDVVLSDTSGPELARALTTLRPDMKVLYMSGYTDDVVLQHGIRDSQIAFLPKPFTRDELIGKVREVLGMVATHSAGK